MSDAELSVRLFLASLAVTAFTLGASQAGWRHRFFIVALFALSVICAAASVWYRALSTRWPTVALSASSLALDARAWFGLVIILAVAVLVLSAVDATRMRRRTQTQGRATVPTLPTAVVPPPAPTISAAAPPVVEERIFVDVTHDFFIRLIQGQTDAQATATTQRYVGKWMRLSGVVRNVLDGANYIQLLITPHREGAEPKEAPRALNDIVSASFDGPWIERLQLTPIGATLTIIGQIARVNPLSGLFLNHCELVER